MGFKQHISRTWQMIEQQVNDVPFRPDDEAHRPVSYKKINIETKDLTSDFLAKTVLSLF